MKNFRRDDDEEGRYRNLMTKNILFALFISLVAAFGKVLANDSITVNVTVEGFRNKVGICRLLLFENKKGFPDSREYAKLMLSGNIREETVKFSFKVKPGIYAISILHDENVNERLDKTWYGKPTEGIGASNNPKIGFGPPGFKESLINLDEKNKYIKIKLNYM